MRPVTPRGFRDILSQEAAERESIARAIGDVMAAWGYGPIETPAAERLDVLEAGTGSSLEGTAFRLFDSDGELLALRPEMTVPITRVVATRLAGEPGPYRLSYSADVFREQASMRGQARQFSQAGLEFIGAGGPSADAEVIAIFVESLRVTGLSQFTVGVGTVSVLRSIIDAAQMEPEWGEAVLGAAHDRNLVELDALSMRPEVAPIAVEALRLVPRIRGGRSAIEECREVAKGCEVDSALEDLDTMWDLLETLGVADAVSIDFGIMRSFDYYTGIVLEAYEPGLGLAIGGGGRYDSVMAEFDRPMPAAGFAIGIERLHIALAEEGVSIEVPGLDAVLGGVPADAFAAAAQLRAAGWRVRLSERAGLDLVREAEAADAPEALLATGDTIVRLDREGQPALPLERPIPEPPTRSWAREEGSR